MNPYRIVIYFFLFLVLTSARFIPLAAQPINLQRAVMLVSPSVPMPMRETTPQLLSEEIAKRTGITLKNVANWPQIKPITIAFALLSDKELLGVSVPVSTGKDRADVKPEGFRVVSEVNKKGSTLWIIGADARGILFGTGWLLRNLNMDAKRLELPAPADVASAPAYPIRGHQLGYRTTANSYDAWTVAQFDQYFRELAIFGTNAIEGIPFHEEEKPSPHFKIPASEMRVRMSEICQKYDLDYWIWTPATFALTDVAKRKAELDLHESFYKACPRLDHIFIPGGDPGDNHPKEVMPFLKDLYTLSIKYHPKAKIWVSPQVFRPTQQWFDAFYKHVNKAYDWFGGVVFGPWVKMPVQEIRKVVKPSIPIRHYPDITHNYASQYPVPHWDLAWAMTLGRESINPRPHDEKAIHNALDEFGAGSISYSEGTNDDVNKFVWSDQDWNPETPVTETLRDYARLFIGPDYTESVAQGLIALEQNWRGNLLTNDAVERTLMQWQALEKSAPRTILQNPRFQMAQYDTYTRRRLLYETDLEQQARSKLETIEPGGSLAAIRQANAILEKAWKEPILPAYRQKCFALADSLYKSIGAQLTIERHGAMSGRGNFIDNIDIPLNDSPWLQSQLAQIEKLSDEKERIQKIRELLHRTDPGPGGFYDHFGTPESWHRVISDLSWSTDPGSLQSPRIGFGMGLVGVEWVDEIKATGFKGQITPRAWMKQAKTLYDQPLKITYHELDPNATYRIRITYTGRFRSRMKLTTDDGSLVHNFIQTGEQPIYEFDVSKAASSDGAITFIWTCGEGKRGSQVTEIWLVRKQ